MNPDFYVIGQIVRTKGLRGEIVVRPFTDHPERFQNLKKVHIDKVASGETSFNIQSVQIEKRSVRLKLEEIQSRNDAEALVGKLLCVTEEEHVRPRGGSHFIHDVVGSSVIDERGKKIGTVTEVWKLPANDVYVVRDGKREHLVPSVRSIIEKIDTEKKEIEIRMIEGL